MIRASLQFAADTKVLAQVHSDAERTKLQEDLDKLTEWAKSGKCLLLTRTCTCTCRVMSFLSVAFIAHISPVLVQSVLEHVHC